MTEKFARWHLLLAANLKRDWKKISLWVILLAGFCAGFVPAFEEISKGSGLIGMYETLMNPAMIAMVGPTPVEEASAYTLGAMYAHEMLLYCGLFSMIISVIHVVGHTRKEEELGLTELIRSFHVGRQANALATMIEIILINCFVTILIAVMMISFNVATITVEGAILFAISIGFAGLLGASLALLMAQIMPTASSATGATLAIIGLFYIIRGLTDVSSPAISEFNPLAWTYLTFPFTDNRWLPVIWLFIFSVFCIGLAFKLERDRDMGASLIPQTEGRANAKPSLLSVPGLLWRLSRGVSLVWFIAFLILGAAYGSIYGDMKSFLESNDILKDMFATSGYSIEVSATGTLMEIMIVLVAILPIVLVNKLFAEEARGHLSQVYVTGMTRLKLFVTTLSFAIISGVIGIALAAGGLGGAALQAMGEQSEMVFSDFILTGFNSLPVTLFFTGLAACLLGWLPRAGKIVYIYLAYTFLMTYFEGLLDLPDWLLKTAVQSWLPQLPVESFEVWPFFIIILISMALMFVGMMGYLRRDWIESI